MTSEQTPRSDPDHQVIPFRRRNSRRPVSPAPQRNPASDRPAVESLAKFERRNDHDDFRHRMVVNTIALIFTAALVAAGIWIVSILTDVRKTQDCVLSGRKNCDTINVAPAEPGHQSR